MSCSRWVDVKNWAITLKSFSSLLEEQIIYLDFPLFSIFRSFSQVNTVTQLLFSKSIYHPLPFFPHQLYTSTNFEFQLIVKAYIVNSIWLISWAHQLIAYCPWPKPIVRLLQSLCALILYLLIICVLKKFLISCCNLLSAYLMAILRSFNLLLISRNFAFLVIYYLLYLYITIDFSSDFALIYWLA